MNFNIEKYLIIYNINFSLIPHIKYKLTSFKTILLQLILINEGSYTKVLEYLNNNKIKNKILQKDYIIFNQINRKIRYIWLKISLKTKLTFARSLWMLIDDKILPKLIIKILPIGLLFSSKKIEIYKNIYEIHSGYTQKFEKNINLKGLIWGRKYILFYKNYSYIIIQEIFSNKILDFFY
uniref:Ycf21 n=1 Tax=Leachiella pacifica TaxID=282357 RepID=A0A3S8UVX7_9FLOR|nr:ycf21 [Leachiella pacifica]